MEVSCAAINAYSAVWAMYIHHMKMHNFIGKGIKNIKISGKHDIQEFHLLCKLFFIYLLEI